MADMPDYGVDPAQDPAARNPPVAMPARLPGEFDAIGMFKDSLARSDATEAGRRKEMDPLVDRAKAANDKPLPEPPTLQKGPDAPRAEFGQAMQGWLQSAMILGAIGGVLGRKHVTNALTAFSGAIEGFKEGKLQDAKTKLDEWKAETDTVLNNNKAMLDQYNAILKNNSMDLDRKMNEVQLVATKWHDRSAYDAASTKNITEFARYLQQVQYHDEQMRLQRDKIDNQTKALRSKMDDHLSGKMDEKTIESMARQALTGDKSVFTNIGRGTQGASNLTAVRAKMAELAPGMGITPERLSQINQEYAAQGAGLRTASNQEAKMGTAIAEAQYTFPMARDAMTALGRSDLPAYNKLQQMYENQTASPELARAYVATRAAVNAYAAVMGRGNSTTTVHAQQEAEKLLSTTMGTDAYKAALDQMEKEMQAVIQAPKASRDRILGIGEKAPSKTGDAGSPAASTEAPTATNKATGEKMIYRDGQWQPMQ